MADDKRDEPTAPDDFDERASSHEGDYIVRAMGLGASIRALAVRSTQTCAELQSRHESMPTASAAVSRVATALLLMGGTIKGREQVSIEVRGNGPLGKIYGIGDAAGHVRVMVDQPLATVPPRRDGRFDVASAVGMGELVVTKNLGMKEPYRGVVPLVSGEIARDLVEYYMSSEQKLTAMSLGEFVDVSGVTAAGGFLLQVFPGADDDALAEVEAAIQSLPPISTLIAEGVTPEGILRRMLPDLEVLETYPVGFRCACSRERFEGVLISLGAEELEDLAATDGEAELVCHFCNRKYQFDEAALRHLLLAATSGIN